MNIKILGAGVGGLTTAIALTQSGFDVQIYERRQRRSHIGAGIVCWPNASFVLKEFGMLEDIKLRSGRPVRMRRLSKTGDDLGALDISKLDEKMGYSSLSILRKDLMEVLENHLNQYKVFVQYEKEVEQIVSGGSGTAMIHFKNGEIESADMIIGADGRMSSVVRKFVNGDNEPIFQKFINWIGVFESDIAVFPEIEVRDYWGVGDRFGIVPVSQNKAYWAGAVAASSIGDIKPSNYKEELFSLFKNWPSPIQSIIQQTPLSKIHKVYVHDHNPIETWHRENVLIIGDAAHALLPTSGQGACQAMEDAWHLTQLLKNNNRNLNLVFQEFTKRRFAKTTSITMGARQFASSLFSTDKNASEMRNRNSKKTDYKAMVNGMAKGWSSGLPIA